eukprot:PhM_4_TR5006/c0_g1_i1/m.2822
MLRSASIASSTDSYSLVEYIQQLEHDVDELQRSLHKELDKDRENKERADAEAAAASLREHSKIQSVRQHNLAELRADTQQLELEAKCADVQYSKWAEVHKALRLRLAEVGAEYDCHAHNVDIEMDKLAAVRDKIGRASIERERLQADLLKLERSLDERRVSERVRELRDNATVNGHRLMLSRQDIAETNSRVRVQTDRISSYLGYSIDTLLSNEKDVVSSASRRRTASSLALALKAENDRIYKQNVELSARCISEQRVSSERS